MVRIVDGRRVSVYRSSLVELLGLITCVETGLGRVAKLLGARAEVRLTRAFGSGTVRRRRCRREGGLEMTVRDKQGRRMTHENGEGEMERYDMRTASTLSHACTRCPHVTQRNCVRKMCVRHGVCIQFSFQISAVLEICPSFPVCKDCGFTSCHEVSVGGPWSRRLLLVGGDYSSCEELDRNCVEAQYTSVRCLVEFQPILRRFEIKHKQSVMMVLRVEVELVLRVGAWIRWRRE